LIKPYDTEYTQIVPTTESDDMRLDELARRAGVATTTVRLYQNKGLLPGPRLVGRTGFYDASHLARLELIGRLQEQGFSLAGIGRLLDTWERGRDLDELVGVERELDALLGRRHEVVLDAADLLARFPDGAVSAELIQRAASMGLVEATADGRFRLPDDRFLHTGAALIRLGVPADVVLDEWAHLAPVTDGIAERFIAVFEDHLLPDDWRRDLGSGKAAELARTLEQLRETAREVVVAAFDASMANAGSRRLGELVALTEPVRAEVDVDG
jgi:DNA-binding transcriptional MerR regulator